MGFAIDKVVATETSQEPSLDAPTNRGEKPIGVLYAKDAVYLNVSIFEILSVDCYIKYFCVKQFSIATEKSNVFIMSYKVLKYCFLENSILN